MMLICDKKDVDAVCAALNERDTELAAKKVGTVTDSGKIEVTSRYSGAMLKF